MLKLSDFGVPLTNTGRGGILEPLCQPPRNFVGLWVGLKDGKVIAMLDLEGVKNYCEKCCPEAIIVQITEDNKDALEWF